MKEPVTLDPMGMIRSGFWFLVAAGTHFLPSLATAQPADEELECVEAYEKTQEARQAGNLLRARALTEMCIPEACHEVIRESCSTWRTELEAEIPSITIRVVDATGKPVGGARVVIDGREPLSSAGRTLELDPGTHSIEASATGYEPDSASFQLVSGERETLIELRLTPIPEDAPPAPPPPPSKRPLPLWPAYVSGAVGAAGFAVLGIMGSKARSGDRDLDTCAPTKTCLEGDVDTVRGQYALANVGLGLGIAGAVGAIGWSIVAVNSRSRSNVGLIVTPSGVSARGRF